MVKVIEIPVEIKGQQLRIRVRPPRLYSVFRVHDVGKKGRLQRVAGKRKTTGEWETQSWRLNLSHYKSVTDALVDLNSIADYITREQHEKAYDLIIKWFQKKIKKMLR